MHTHARTHTHTHAHTHYDIMWPTFWQLHLDLPTLEPCWWQLLQPELGQRNWAEAGCTTPGDWRVLVHAGGGLPLQLDSVDFWVWAGSHHSVGSAGGRQTCHSVSFGSVLAEKCWLEQQEPRSSLFFSPQVLICDKCESACIPISVGLASRLIFVSAFLLWSIGNLTNCHRITFTGIWLEGWEREKERDKKKKKKGRKREKEHSGPLSNKQKFKLIKCLRQSVWFHDGFRA